MRKLILSWAIVGCVGIAALSLFKTSPSLTSPKKEKKEKERGADRQMELFWQARAYPDHKDLNDKFYKAWLHAKAMKVPEVITGTEDNAGASGANDINFGAWSQAGNLHVGRVLSIAIHPTTTSTLFIGSASGGIYKSTNSGTSWSYVNTGFPVLGVPAITFHPSNGNIILAGTGEVYRVDTANIGYNIWKARGSYGVGILRSTDGGNTWSQVLVKNYDNLFGVQAIKFDPTNANIVYACTTNGLFKSTDAGATWGASPVLNKIYVSDVVINSTNANQMMAAVGNLVNADKGIYRTTDGGTNWTKVGSVLPTSFSGYTKFAYLSGNTVYASIGRDDAGEVELYRSTNFGSTFTSLANSHHCEYQFWFANTVAIIPSRPDSLLMGGVGFYRYRVSTTTATTIAASMHADHHDIKFDPSNSNICYVANDGGVFRSSNALATSPTFTEINNGLNIAQFYASLGVSKQNANRFAGGLQDNGVWSYTGGASWAKEFGGDGGPTVIDPNDDQIVYASNDARKLNKSTTGVTGTYSTVLSSWAFVGDDRTGFMSPVAMSKASSSTIYVASDNLHKTTNSGTSWTNNNTTIANNTSYIEAQFKTAISLAVSNTNANKLYVSLSPFSQRTDNRLNVVGNPTVFKSTNGGTSFTNITSGLPNRFVLDFAISETNDDSVYVTLGGYGSSHVYVSGNGGSTWADRGTGLPDVPFNAIVIDPVNPNIIYAGCDLGVYVSPNRGANWFDFNAGFADATMVFDLQISSDNKLVAATHGKSVWISDLATNTILPVKITTFTGSNKTSYNELKWNISQINDVAKVELERSINGNSYTSIKTFINVAEWNSNTYNDALTATEEATYFYRLKVTGKNGVTTYSSVVAIRVVAKAQLKLLQNPVSTSIQFEFTTTSRNTLSVQLVDANGRVVRKENFSITAPVNRFAINNIQALPTGTYYLHAKNGNNTFTKKILKQ